MILSALYVAAAALANLAINFFGPSASPVVAFFFIGLDITTRDFLHERWKGDRLALRMFALILAGSIASAIIDVNSSRIALASFLSFAASGVIDALVYHAARSKAKLVRINASNSASALADSLIFPFVAFGAFLPSIILAQFFAKFIGGAAWAKVIVSLEGRSK